MEEKSKTAALKEEGNHKAEELLGMENIYDPEHIDVLHHIYQGLKAHHLFRRDVDYMVKDGEVVIVDEFTGRLMPGRSWSDGLHQAIEAKEGLKVKKENQTLASITFQNFFRMYNVMSGMTGTAETESVEFQKIYHLNVMVIPTNKPIRRKDQEDVIYKTELAKVHAMASDIKEKAQHGQPILVGTVSIEKSEFLSRELKKLGVDHNILNAKHHEREADIVAQAGRKNAITIATNMAGRGTDIVLGGNAEAMAKNEAEEGTPEFDALLKKYEVQCAAEKEEVLKVGGLYIMGTERHESRRIDNQLRGRSGRQGDPGESRFYLSLEDDLMRIFNGERIQKIMSTLNVPDDEPIIAGMVTRAIEGAQRKVEGHNFDIRKHLLEYDDVMNQQRTSIYALRRQALSGENMESLVLDMLGDVTSHILDTFVPEEAKKEHWDLDGLNNSLRQQFGLMVEFGELAQLTTDRLTDMVSQGVKEIFDRQKEHLKDYFDQVLKMILLQTIDQKWKEHLQRNDQLKEGINLRAYAQKDPLIEYKKEAFAAFEKLHLSIRSEFIEKLLKIQMVASDEATEEMRERQMRPERNLQYEGADDSDIGAFGGNAPLGSMQAPQQEMNYSSGGSNYDQPEERKMNRSERRKLEKQKKKRR